MFKFVIDRKKTLYIGLQSGYHMNICGNLDAFDVVGAGYLRYDDSVDEWTVYGNSVGYGIGFGPSQEADIIEALTPFSVDGIYEMFPDTYRSAIDMGIALTLLQR